MLGMMCDLHRDTSMLSSFHKQQLLITSARILLLGMLIVMQTSGDLWLSNAKTFFPSDGDIGLATLFADTLEILEADGMTEAAAGHGCDLMQTASAFRLTAYVRPWCAS